MVTRLSGVDAVSLHTQTSTTPSHTVALIVVEASDALSHARLHQLVASSLPQLARFRSRLVGKPLGVGQPVWAEIDDYDPTSQIHSATVRAPGGHREFADLVSQLSTRPLDCRRSLWEAWSIDGLAGGQWALAVKMSPVLSERGGGAASIWRRLVTGGPHDATPNNVPTEPSLGPAPSLVALVTDMVTEIVENQVTGVWLVAEAVTGALQALRRRMRTGEPDPISPAVPSMSGPVPHTMFNAPLTRRRAVAFASIPLTDVETVSNAFGGSTANVFLAACTLSLRAWLQHHDSVPENPLLIQVPVSLPIGDPAVSANPLAVGPVRLPVQLDDPVQVLTNLHTATERLTIACRNHEEKDPKVDFATIASLIPPPVVHAGMQFYTGLGLDRWRAPICHGSVSYVAAKPAPAYCAGAKVVGMHTAAPLQGGYGLNITVTFHDDVMDLCVCACPDNVPEVDDIATGIAESVDLLVAAATASPRGSGRSVITEMKSHATKRSHGRRH
jgi:diacylglycerol O-acyltransferase